MDAIWGGEWGWTRDCCIRWGSYRRRGRAVLSMGPLLHSCAKDCEPIELSFGMVSGVGPGIDVRNGVHVPQGKGEFWGCLPNGFNE